jgi:hypothetical protein
MHAKHGLAIPEILETGYLQSFGAIKMTVATA